MKLRTVLLTTALLAAAPAHAATFLITYTGTVANGFDHSGVFGSGPTLSGDFTAVYTLTDPLPGEFSYSYPNVRSVYGGSSQGAGVPSPVSATLTINGVTKAFSGNYFGQALQQNSGPDYVYHGASMNEYDFLENQIYSYVNDIVNTADYTAPLDYTVQGGDLNASSFHLGDAFGTLVANRVTIAPVATNVPEPATWATMILGFGLVGAAMRRKQRQTVRYSFA